MRKLNVFLPSPPVEQQYAEINAADKLEGYGYIKYDPERPGMKRRTDWWCILQVPGDIADYYRSMVETRYGISLCQPSWGSHVSIIRGEKPSPECMHLWKKYDGQKVKFTYDAFPRFNGDTRIVTNHEVGAFWFLDVECPELANIRKEFGFPYDWKLHLTIGRNWGTGS